MSTQMPMLTHRTPLGRLIQGAIPPNPFSNFNVQFLKIVRQSEEKKLRIALERDAILLHYGMEDEDNSAAVTASLAATNTLSVSDAITAPLVNLAAGDWDAQSCSPNLVLMSALPLPQLSLNSIDEAVERPMAGVSLLGDGPVCHIVEERDDCKTLTLPVMTANLGSLRQPFNVCSTVSSDCSMPSPSSLHLTSPKKL
uniref:Uncharacterized protein n=1 Tax=Glossina austeni TaxID=7395 RepID=A0A1A9V6B8_GLOAU